MNINNIKKLLKVYFYENWKNDVIYNFVIMIVLSLMFVLLTAGAFQNSIIYIAAVVLIIYYPCRVFSKLHQASSRIHYLMIPASKSEKVVTGMLLTNVYYVLGIIISISLGFLIGYSIMTIINPDYFAGLGIHNLSEFMMTYTPLSLVKSDDFAQLVLKLYVGISAMFFAAIYFRKSPFWKLMLVGFIVFMVLAIIMLGTEWLNVLVTVPAEIRNGNYYKTEHYLTTSSDWYLYVLYSLAIVYFYAMSFLRMRETEA